MWAWNNLGYVHLQRKQYQEAAEALAEATSRKGATGLHVEQPRDRVRAPRSARRGAARVRDRRPARIGEAKASRKRLEGVDSIAIYQPTTAPVERTYEVREEMPAVPAVEDAADALVDEHADDADAEAVEAAPAVDAVDHPSSPI